MCHPCISSHITEMFVVAMVTKEATALDLLILKLK